MNKKGVKIILILLVALLITAFVSIPTYAAKGNRITLSNDVQWVNHSIEYKLCVRQAYLNAIRRLEELAKNLKPGTWCVVLDTDETILSNIGFQKFLQASGQEYSASEPQEKPVGRLVLQAGKTVLLRGLWQHPAFARDG